MNDPLVLSLDLGTSSVRALVFDRRGQALADSEVQVLCPPETTEGGGAEFDAEALFGAVVDLVDAAVRKTGPGRGHMAAVAMCTFWHSLVGVDARGRAITPVLIWSDRRSAEAALDVEPGQLSLLVDAGETLGPLRTEYARRWPGLAQASWHPALGDGACSKVGAGCSSRDRFALMVGTSGALRAAFPATDVVAPWGLWTYRLDRRHALLGGALNNGGNLYAWLQDTLDLPHPDAAEAELARLEPDSHGLTVLPFLAGERSPDWPPDASGAIIGLTSATRPIQILQAMLEAVALRFALLERALSRAIGQPREIIATGGALLHSPAWTRMMADALGRPVTASTEEEASSRGAALMAPV